MEPIVKQRLVGALVLLALGVVFWPIIFVEAPEPEMLPAESMPPRPAVDTSPLEVPEVPRERISAQLPKLPDQADAQRAADTATELAEPPEDAVEPETLMSGLPEADELEPLATREQPPAEPVLDEQGLGVAWVLQVATVSSETRAQALLARLGDKGYKAFIKPIKRDKRSLYRVQIGPKVERARLEKIKAVIDPELRVESAILRYVQ
ncbi:MAG: SPOR domain-containing protein [Halieaceae bacterium]|jgi:DedD protein|nr:SPOR domain-containing protein [Halieaceae bacterium]